MTLATVKSTFKGSLLIVDDDPTVRDILQVLLDHEGFQCEAVGSSDEAIEALGRERIDLVITDLFLEGSSCSGLEIIDYVKRHDETIPVILITGFPSISQAVDAMKRGAVDFLTKPFDRDLLLHQVNKALQEHRLRRENQRLQAEVNKTAVIEKLNRELHSRINELTRLYAISEGLNEFLDTPALFDRIAFLTAKVTRAQRVSVMVLDRTRRFLKIRSAIGVPKQVIAKTIVRLGDGIAGQVALSGEPLRHTERMVEAHNHNDPSATRTRYRTRSYMSLPLLVGQEIFGVINMTDKLDGGDFTREDEQIMLSLAEKAGIKLENQALYEGIYSNLVDTLTSLVTTIEAKDPYTREHSQRVTDYAIGLAEFLKLDQDSIEMLNFAGMLHDIGKIGVNDSILTKAGRLTDNEYSMIKQHPRIGEKIVSPLGLVESERAIILHHHERFDGHGYPDGLAGEKIPYLARIVAIADAFDAMTTTRSYRRAMPVDEAINEMIRCSGTQFDPKLLQAWVRGIELKAVAIPESSITCNL